MEFVEKLEGDELLKLIKELNKFHLELWAMQFAEIIRDRHYEITREFKLLDT